MSSAAIAASITVTPTRHHRWVAVSAIGCLVALAVIDDVVVGAVDVDAIRIPPAVWLLMAVVLHVGSMVSFGHMQRSLLARVGFRSRFRRTLAIVYAGNAVAVTVPVAGPSAAAAYTYRQYVRRGATAAAAGWSLAMAGVFSAYAFATMVGIAALASGNPVIAIAGLVTGTAVAMAVGGVILAARHTTISAAIEPIAVWLVSSSQRLLRRPRGAPAELVANGLAQLSAFRVGRGTGIAAFSFAALNWLLDALCLWAVLQAVDVAVSWRELPLLYIAAVAAASIGFTPAGIGTAETALALLIVQLGGAGTDALAAAVAYRAISAWSPIAAGWVLVVVMRHQSVPPQPMTTPAVVGQAA